MTSNAEPLRIIDEKTVGGAGYKVAVPDAHHALYSEEGRIARIGIDCARGGDGQVTWQVLAESLTDWEPPDGGPVMTEEQRRRILARVGHALIALGMPCEAS